MSLPKPYYESDKAVLYHGDCLAILPHLSVVDAVVTDPPYGMGFRSNHRNVRHAAIAGDGCTSLLRFACEIPANHSRYVFCRWDNIRDIPKPKSLCTWVKNNWSMGDLDHEHARQTEVFAFWPGPAHFWPSYRPTDVFLCDRTGNDNHPSEKPVELLTNIVKLTSGLVLDPFMGSGTTGVACMKLGRKFIGVEIELSYCRIAEKRIREAEQWDALFQGASNG